MLLRPGTSPGLIQNRIQQKEQDFQQSSLADTALMGSLVDQTYTEATLQQTAR